MGPEDGAERDELKGPRIALVTGASRGIGRAIALRLARDGVVVAVHYGRRASAADEVVAAIREEGGSAFPVHAELGVDGDVDALFAAFDDGLREHGAGGGGGGGAGADEGAGEGVIDILVNNAGIGTVRALERVRPDYFERVFAVNVQAPFFILQRALPRLRDGGRIVNISSVAARIPYPESAVYAMSKAALDSLGRTLAKTLGPRGITVNTVSPGIIDTDMNALWLRDSAEGAAYAAGKAALGRAGMPEDVADIVAFLVSSDARWLTGAVLDAAGGSGL